MTVLSDYVARMVDAGMDATEAMQIVAEVFAAGAANVAARSSNAARQQRYRDRKKAAETVTNRNETVTERNAPNDPQTVTNRNVVTESNAGSLSKRVIDNKKEEGKRERRATQIDDGWRPDDRRWAEARRALGDDDKVERELRKFTNHALANGRKAKNWGAAWDNWVDRAVEWAPKNQPPPAGRPMTVHQQRQLESKEAFDALRNASSRMDFGVQRHDSSHGQAGVHSGVRGTIIDLSAARDREGHEPVEGATIPGSVPELGKVSGAS